MVSLSLRPTVLVLVQGREESAEVQRALRAQWALPVAIRPGGAVAAMAHYRPAAVVLDVAHMATAPDDFLAAAAAANIDVICIGPLAGRPLRGVGQADRHRGPATRLARGAHAPPMHLSEMLHDRQAEPGAAFSART